MNALENEYFEEYKSVELICNDIYENGVSGYIDDMTEKASYAVQYEPNWNKKIKVLKHLRWLRNRIAHGGEDYEVTEQDLQSIRMFHSELLTGKDPLALLNSYKKSAKPAAKHPRGVNNTVQTFESGDNDSEYDERGWNGWVILLALGIILLIVFLASRAH